MMLNKHRIYIFHVENIKTGEEKNTNNNRKKRNIKKGYFMLSCFLLQHQGYYVLKKVQHHKNDCTKQTSFITTAKKETYNKKRIND